MLEGMDETGRDKEDEEDDDDGNDDDEFKSVFSMFSL